METLGPNANLTKSGSVPTVARWFIGTRLQNVTLENGTVLLKGKVNELT